MKGGSSCFRHPSTPAMRQRRMMSVDTSLTYTTNIVPCVYTPADES